MRLLLYCLRQGGCLQRLFPMFPYGWPGRGLLLPRLVVVLILIHDGIGALMGGPQRKSISLQVIAAIAAVFLLAGLWTPIAGGIVTLSEFWIILTGADDPRSTILLATLGTALAFLGPGALSVDARLFGRKRLDIEVHGRCPVPPKRDANSTPAGRRACNSIWGRLHYGVYSTLGAGGS